MSGKIQTVYEKGSEALRGFAVLVGLMRCLGFTIRYAEVRMSFFLRHYTLNICMGIEAKLTRF
jgi:hypothetical protein